MRFIESIVLVVFLVSITAGDSLYDIAWKFFDTHPLAQAGTLLTLLLVVMIGMAVKIVTVGLGNNFMRDN